MDGKSTIHFFVVSLLFCTTLCETMPKQYEMTVALKYDGVAVSIGSYFSFLDGQIHLNGSSGLIFFYPKPAILETRRKMPARIPLAPTKRMAPTKIIFLSQMMTKMAATNQATIFWSPIRREK
jgi:hypothetical protein